MLDEITEDLAPVPGMPEFILSSPDGETVRWWCPIRTGDNARDYEAGMACFDSIMQACRALAGHPSNALSSILVAMETIGPIERGFIDRLAAKATYGRVPDPAPESMVIWATELNPSISVECIRDGEAYARNMIEAARFAAAAFLIAEDIVNFKVAGGYDGVGYVWTMCVAASAGAAN